MQGERERERVKGNRKRLTFPMNCWMEPRGAMRGGRRKQF